MRNTQWSLVFGLFATLAIVAACGSPAASSTGASTSDTSGVDVGGLADAQDSTSGSDGIASDAGKDAATDDTTADATDDTAALDGDSADATNCEFSKTPAPGEPGAPCTGNGDCDSAVCIDGLDGKICTSTCTTCCPTGFACEQAPGVDASFVCLPKQLALCTPCQTDAQCAQLDAKSLCISYGADGHFCGGGCSVDKDCPADHTCQLSAGELGQGKQCVKTVGTCGCSALAVFKGASTTCSATNANGSCSGSRKCAADGLTACDAPMPETETCNDVDDNCNGKTDEPGALGCVNYFKDADGDAFGAKSLGCLCIQPSSSATQGGDCNDAQGNIRPGGKEICDGVDNNCDGLTDPGFPDANGDGFADCVDGDIDGDGVINSLDCSPTDAAVHTGAIELCDGVDNDCNGTTDDAGAKGCTLWYQDDDADGFGAAANICYCKATGLYTAAVAGDCDDENGAVFPGAPESCNGKDDDCNGMTDAQDAAMLLTACDLTAGVCAAAMHIPARCVAGKFQACTTDDYTANALATGAAAYNAGVEALCDGADNDCDGAIDDDFAVQSADGATVQGVGAACGVGACAGGVTVCNPEKTATLCTTATATSAEVCDGSDNDCDGKTDGDDGDLSLPSCAKQLGVCSGSIHPANLCVSGAWQVCDDGVYTAHTAAYQASSEAACDSLDNDCDGKTDEDFSVTGADGMQVDGAGMACGAGACASGITVCSANGAGILCATDALASAEICDGKDNDCDGLTDGADTDLVIPACESQAGVCSGSQHPVALCQDGAWQACGTAEYLAHSNLYEVGKELTCDGKDNDCDGASDEDFNHTQLNGAVVSGVGSACGVGTCAGGVTACNAAFNGIECQAEAAATQEVCDSLDNDCDGKIDVADSSLLLAACENQTGVCAVAKHAASECVLGSWLTCTAADYGASYESGLTESLCDGLDGNCNGTVDDIGVLPLNANQVGACNGSSKKCDGAGGFVDDYSAVPGYGQYEAPDAFFADENCDGIDGTVAGALFVSVNGVDSGACSKGAPCQTLNFAVSKASGSANQDIYVMAGNYGAVTIDKANVRIWGGYDGNWQRAAYNGVGHKVTITGALDVVEQQVMAVKIRATGVALADLVLAGIDASGDIGGNGKSSYVVHAKDADGLDIRRCDFLQGNGAVGVAGSNGGDASASAAAKGSNGGGASQGVSLCSTSSGGGGGGGAGSNASCSSGTGGGGGGSGGSKDTSCGWSGSCGVSGNCNARSGGGGAAGAGGAAAGSGGNPCSVGSTPGAGAVSNGNAGGGATSATGLLSSDYWLGKPGGSGGLGSAGGGGGGAGGSGGCDDGDDSEGAGGGGGGQGGCAAPSAATGGGAGGSSFGLFVVHSGGAPFSYTVSACTFTRGNGATGGAGGIGGRGQSGGAGGNGGGSAGGSPAALNGGHGGHGGHGGGGGGGAGGNSYGIFAPSSAIGTTSSLLYQSGALGSGGAGGASAPTAPAGELDGKAGSAGIDGTRGEIMTCSAPGGC